MNLIFNLYSHNHSHNKIIYVQRGDNINHQEDI